MKEQILQVLFPPKCILCRRLLRKDEMDLCHSCRADSPVFSRENFRFSFIARWTAVWYYKDTVRASLLRYKFHNRRSYADAYGRLLAMKLQTEGMDDFDILSWVPVSRLRRLKRGYDQVELLARAVARELGVPCVPTLVKVRNTPPQSRIPDAAGRRANVMNAYRAKDPKTVSGKQVLLLDDIITTGATVSECAKTLLISGAKEISTAAVAVAAHNKNM